MDVWEGFDNGYELMGTSCYADDIAEMANRFKDYYSDVFWGRYKSIVGQEDAYAVMCRNPKHITRDVSDF